MSKSGKIGFKIKLTSETSEKLRHENSETRDKDVGDKCHGEPKGENDSEENLEIDKTTAVLESLDVVAKSSPTYKDDPKQFCSDNNSTENVSATVVTAGSIHDSQNSDQDQNVKKKSFDDYAQYIRYHDEVAIYTDPSTNVEYIWCLTKNEWVLKSEEEVSEQSELKTADNVVYENGVATYTDGDGTVFIWDKDKNAWFPKLDEDFMAQYQMSYGFVDNTTDSTKEKNKKEEELQNVERKSEEKGIKRKNPDPPKWFDISDDQNTSVYVSNLPLDITEEEFVDLMQKCGLVMRDLTTQKMKIKLYTKPNSKQLKGDGLCTYIKKESVELAENILDGYTFKNHRIQVQRAQFQMKGDYNPALKPKKKKRKEKEKLKKMQEKLFDWRPEKFRGERSKHEKVVIIKNLFEPKLFDKEVHLILEYQEDLREECAKLGEVRKVCLFDRHPEGVAQIVMKEPEEADNVVKLLNNRWFGKRQLTAEIWDGKTKYKMEETDADLNKRIENWEKSLEEKDQPNPSVQKTEELGALNIVD